MLWACSVVVSTVCGEASAAYCADAPPLAFQPLMSQSQMPYKAWVADA